MSKAKAFPLHLEYNSVIFHFIDMSIVDIVKSNRTRRRASTTFAIVSTDLVALVDIETSVLKNCPEVLASCTVRHVSNENLGRLPEH